MEKSLVELEKINFTLNQISISGQDNLSRLLGCIQAINKIIADIKNSTQGEDNV